MACLIFSSLLYVMLMQKDREYCVLYNETFPNIEFHAAYYC